LYAIFLALKYF